MTKIDHAFEPLEPTLANAIILIENDPSLTDATKTQWLCSIRRIAKWLDRPLEVLPARFTALRQPVNRLNSARIGVSRKTLSNHKSNFRAAINHVSGKDRSYSRGVPLLPAYSTLHGKIDDRWASIRLLCFFRYLSGLKVDPHNVTDQVLEGFFDHREQTTFHNVTLAYRRSVARAWNRCMDTVEGFPANLLTVEALKPRFEGPEWDEFPSGFRDEVEAYLDFLASPHRSSSGRRRKACKQSTINTRRREIMAAAKLAVRLGTPIEGFTELRNLVEPKMVRKVLDEYWKQYGEQPSQYAIDLAWKLLSIARQTNCLSETELKELDDIRYTLEEHRRQRLTDKNFAIVRTVLSGSFWIKVIGLPDKLMAEAMARRKISPMKAAVLARTALAIRLLTYAPVRIGNLAAISLEENLIRPDLNEGPYWLIFPDHDVKNNTELTFEFDAKVTRFIERYIRDFRPVLLRGSNSSCLFPGGKGEGEHILSSSLSDHITKCINKELGIRITAHQFRHAAAAIILKSDPGNYELVRRILGHKNIQTTINFYVGLETLESSRQFGELIDNYQNGKPDDR